jgi:hypothetical protein
MDEMAALQESLEKQKQPSQETQENKASSIWCSFAYDTKRLL